MNQTLIDVAVILVLIMASGVFVAAEMSLVTLRDSQVRQLAHRSKRGRTVAKLNDNPNRFLSAVQIGVTLFGFLSAAFGGATLADRLTPVLVRTFQLQEGLAATIALIIITVLISYVSIVVGELTVKRLALQRSEAFALALAPLVDAVATFLRPVIWFLGASTNVLVRLLGGDPTAGRQEVSDEEIRALVSGSTTMSDEERRIVDDVFSAGERALREVMVPRTEVDFLPGDMPAHRAVREVLKAPHSRYPVTGESADDVIGFLHLRELLDPEVGARTTPIRELVRPVLSMPGTVRVLRALNDLRRERQHLAIVMDEYGGTAGIVTIEDLVEELVGEIDDEYDIVADDPLTTSGESEVDGLLSLDEFAERTGLVLQEGPYDTLAGYFMARLGQLPAIGDEIETDALERSDPEVVVRLQLRVTEMDGRRAARFWLHRLEDAADEASRGERGDQADRVDHAAGADQAPG
ncbi:MAG TPA: hemolysin family protein [Microlunatus sp.]|nr:hemolysin family protein [Microlunatus sp.]